MSLARVAQHNHAAAVPHGDHLRLTRSPLQRVADGDADAVQECLDAYGNIVWALARRLAFNASDAEDAVQEIFIDLWKSAHRFDPEQGSEVTFVAMIARRRLIDRNRATSRRDAMLERARSLVSEPDPQRSDADLEQNDEVIQAQQAFDQLSDAQQRVLRLAIHGGLTHEEIAGATAMPLGTVKTHARRGLMRVRELLAQDDSTDDSNLESNS